jgi:hypothetical protein
MGFERDAAREMDDGEGMWFGTGLRASATARQARFGIRVRTNVGGFLVATRYVPVS